MKISLKKETKIRILLFILIAIWAILVFIFSSQDGDDSTGLSQMVAKFLFKDEIKANIAEPYIRKIAHFSEYGIGGVLFMCLFLTYKWSDIKQILVSIVFGIWYASFDEIHQMMVPERNGSIVDVGIDVLGFCTGVVCMMLLYKIICRIKEKKK